MTTEHDPSTRIVLSWLREDAYENAERVLLRALDEVDATPQRRQWPAWRHLDMTNLRALAGAAALVLVVAAAVIVVPSLGVGRNPTPSPTPVITPAPSGLVLLDVGTHTTSQFQPQLTYTVPVGWGLNLDEPRKFTIAPAAFSNAILVVCRDPQPGDAKAKPVEIDGTGAEALSTWFSGRSELGISSGPTPITMGGLDGYWFELRAPSDGPEIGVVGYAGDSGCGINLYPGQRMRLAFLDAPDTTLLVYIWDSIDSDQFVEAASTITESFSFASP